jgi:acyl dehydratase
MDQNREDEVRVEDASFSEDAVSSGQPETRRRRRAMDMSLVGKRSEPFDFDYTEKDVILYALAVGAQAEDLHYVYEGAPGGMTVVPSFGVLAGRSDVVSLLGGDVDFPRLLHGEQMIRLHRPIPPRGRITSVGVVRDIFDKGKAAVIRLGTESRTSDGELLFESESALFYMGEGGFGGPRGPKAERLDPPEGVPPDVSVSYRTSESQAALYRLTGDRNPLHIDPAEARRVGFERPILHGMCTYGFATRAIVEGMCDGDASRFREFRARLSNVVFPGDTVTTEGWRQDDGRYIVRVRTERGPVMTNAFAEIA